MSKSNTKTTSGIPSPIYGSEVWKQATKEISMWGAMPKLPMTKKKPEKHVVITGVEL